MAPFIHDMLEENKRSVMTPNAQRIRMTELYSVELKKKRDDEVVARDSPDSGLVADKKMHYQNARIQVRKCRGGAMYNRDNAISALRQFLAAKRALDACNQRIAKYDGMIADPETLIQTARDSQQELIHSEFHEAMLEIGWLNVDKAEDDHEKALDNASRMKEMKDLREQQATETGDLYKNDNEDVILAKMFDAMLRGDYEDEDEAYHAVEPPSRVAPPSNKKQHIALDEEEDETNSLAMDDLLQTTQRRISAHEQQLDEEEGNGSDGGGNHGSGCAPLRMHDVQLITNRKTRSIPA